MSFATKNHYNSRGPNGFRAQKSTETTTRSFTECTQEALDTRLHAIGIFFLFYKSIHCHKS